DAIVNALLENCKDLPSPVLPWDINSVINNDEYLSYIYNLKNKNNVMPVSISIDDSLESEHSITLDCMIGCFIASYSSGKVVAIKYDDTIIDPEICFEDRFRFTENDKYKLEVILEENLYEFNCDP